MPQIKASAIANGHARPGIPLAQQNGDGRPLGFCYPHNCSSMFSNPSALLGSLLFGAVGFVAFMYGKKMVLWKPMVFGVALMAYPYFVPQTWLMYTIGCALCLGLYVFRG